MLPRLPLTLLLVALPARAAAQTLDEVRDEIRTALDETNYTAFVTSLVDLSGENELAAANYRIDDGLGTRVGTLKLPYRTTFDADEDGEGWYVEGNLGYLEAEAVVPDFLAGTELSTRIDADWKVYSVLAGGGYSFGPGEGVALTPLFDVLLARVESEACYSGAGAQLVPSLLDGLFFNWNAWILTYGPGLRFDWREPLSETVALETLARYDLRRSTTLSSTDPVQDEPVTSQRFTLRGDVTGPTPVRISGELMRWRATLGFAAFPGETGDALGFDSIVSVGGALELPLGDSLPLVSELSLSGALLFGPDVSGWTVGVGASF